MDDLLVLPCKRRLALGPLALYYPHFQPASAVPLLSAERPVAVDWAVAREKYQAAQAEGVPAGEWPSHVNSGGGGGGICSALPFFMHVAVTK